MAKNGTIRCYDYVNHPYDKIRNLLSNHAEEVFQNATKTAALRAHTVASGLHVNIGGIEIGKEVSIEVIKSEDLAKESHSPPTTKLYLEWEATKRPQLFPVMKAELSVFPLTSTETQLVLSGNYKVPLGVLGVAFDSAVGHRIAEASVLRFITDVAAYLRTNLSQSTTTKRD